MIQLRSRAFPIFSGPPFSFGLFRYTSSLCRSLRPLICGPLICSLLICGPLICGLPAQGSARCPALHMGGVSRRIFRAYLPHHICGHILKLPRLPEKHFYFFIIFHGILQKCLLRGIQDPAVLWLCIRVQHGLRQRSCSLLRPKHLLQPCRQLLLQIDGIELSYIHGLHLNVHLFLGIGHRAGFFSRLALSISAVPALLLPVRIPLLFRQAAVFPLILLTRDLLLRLRLRDPFLRRRFLNVLIKAVVIDLLLGRGQRLVQHLQLHGLHHVFSLAEPQNQLVTFLHAPGGQPNPVIEISQLIGPFLPVVPLLQLLEDADPLLEAHVLRFIHLVLQDITPRIPGRCLYEFLIKIYRLHKISGLDAQLAEGITDCPAPGPPLIGQQKHIFRILVPPVDLV